jgi:hypothetical protein
MNYGIAEQEIADKLNAHFLTIGMFEKFSAAVMPETDAQAKAFEALYPKSRVAVEFIDSNFQNPDTLSIVKQNETPKFRLLFEGQKMRGIDGLFSMIEEAKLCLLGYRLANTDPLYITGYGKLQFEPGIWLPYLDFECKTMNIQLNQCPDPVLGGSFQGIVAQQ